MTGRVALIQQQAALATARALSPFSDPWQWWTAEDIAFATNTPVLAVLSDWPLIWAALEAHAIADYDTARVVLATIAIETAHTFKPVTEAFWKDDAWRWANLRYAPYWGRGYVQLTWEENYRWYGWRIGHPELVDFPEKALDPFIASQLLATYFADKGIALEAARHDWAECRRLVQGAYAGLDELTAIISELHKLRLDEPIRLSQVLESAHTRIGDPYVWDGEVAGSFDCSGFMKWTYQGLVTSFTDAIYYETSENLYPAPGDIVLYEYYDPSQQGVRFPHVGLWLNEQETLDARFGYGVGVHPHVVGAKQYVRRVHGVIADTVPQRRLSALAS